MLICPFCIISLYLHKSFQLHKKFPSICIRLIAGVFQNEEFSKHLIDLAVMYSCLGDRNYSTTVCNKKAGELSKEELILGKWLNFTQERCVVHGIGIWNYADKMENH